MASASSCVSPPVILMDSSTVPSLLCSTTECVPGFRFSTRTGVTPRGLPSMVTRADAGLAVMWSCPTDVSAAGAVVFGGAMTVASRTLAATGVRNTSCQYSRPIMASDITDAATMRAVVARRPNLIAPLRWRDRAFSGNVFVSVSATELAIVFASVTRSGGSFASPSSSVGPPRTPTLPPMPKSTVVVGPNAAAGSASGSLHVARRARTQLAAQTAAARTWTSWSVISGRGCKSQTTDAFGGCSNCVGGPRKPSDGSVIAVTRSVGHSRASGLNPDEIRGSLWRWPCSLAGTILPRTVIPKAVDDLPLDRPRAANGNLNDLRHALTSRLSALEAALADPGQSSSLERLMIDLARVATSEAEASASRAWTEAAAKVRDQTATLRQAEEALDSERSAAATL